MVANLALVNPPGPTCPSPSKKKLGSHFIVSAGRPLTQMIESTGMTYDAVYVRVPSY